MENRIRLMVLGAVALLAAPAVGQDRFGADNPWFRDFEATCRVDAQVPPIREDCALGVLTGLAAYKGYTNGACDWWWFWEVADSMQKQQGETFDVLPWQYAVEVIFEHGACEGYTDYGKSE